MEYRGINPVKVITQLKVIEENSGLFEKNRRQNRTAYFNGKGWIYLERTHRRILSAHNWIMLLDIFLKTLLRNSGRYSIKNLRAALYICRSDVNASRIRLRNNVIAYYPEFNLICKFTRKNPKRGAECLNNEYNTLMKLGNYKKLSVPLVHSYLKSPTEAIFMDYVGSREIDQNCGKSICKNIITKITEWYEFCGLKFVPLKDHSVFKYFCGNCAEPLRYGWSQNASEKIREALNLVSDLKVVMSRIHGDLYPSNIIMGIDAEFSIIDWELSREDMIAIDFHTLSALSLAVEEEWVRWRTAVDNGEGKTHANVEFQLAYIIRNYDLSKLASKSRVENKVLEACDLIINVIRSSQKTRRSK